MVFKIHTKTSHIVPEQERYLQYVLYIATFGPGCVHMQHDRLHKPAVNT